MSNLTTTHVPKIRSSRLKKTIPKQPVSPPCPYGTPSFGEREEKAREPMLPTCPSDLDLTPESIQCCQEINREEGEEGENERLFRSENCRRFSSRVRRKTDFYAVNHSEEEKEDLPPKQPKESRKRKLIAVPPVCRRLQFDPEPQQSFPAKADAPPSQALYRAEGCGDAMGDGDECPRNSRGFSRGDKKRQEIKEGDNRCGDKFENRQGHIESDSNQMDSNQMAQTKSSSSTDAPSEQYPVGTIVWGKLPGYEWWPGVVISYTRGKERDSRGRGGGGEGGEGEEDEKEMQVWVKWYGESNLSQISMDKIALFSQFCDYFNSQSLKGIYKRGVFTAIKEAARRCKMEFVSRTDDKTPHWIISDGSPEPKLIGKEKEGKSDEGGGEESQDVEDKEKPTEKVHPKSEGQRGGKGKKGKTGRGDRGTILLTSLEQEMLQWAQQGFQPTGPEGLKPNAEQSVMVQVVPLQSGAGRREVGKGGGEVGDEDEPPKKKTKVLLLQIRRKAHFESVLEGKMKISDICIGCGDMEVVAEHPLFEGGLCRDCKETFLECTYLFDDDGTQMYCCICSAGEEVFMCDAQNCAKVYCAPCIDKLCGASELERVKASEQWLCYMCCPQFHQVGLLTRREDWDRKLQELFLNDHEMEYELPPPFPPIPPEDRKPIRVLGLFDGIGTGLLVLKELGIEVETYVASEVDPDAIKVSRVWHHEIFHIGDISKITEKEVQVIGPFDLVIGGSPCNDLSIVNPARKGIYEGTGRLFFEFFRLLSYVKSGRGQNQPLFWLYENVVSMRAQDKQTISRFLQCNPVVVDAKDISATHRARYFWGNIPGMHRATTPLPGDKLTLQDCLEPNCSRLAQFTKLRTITTKMNSIKQTKKAIYPVRVGSLLGVEREGLEEEKEEMQGDVLWCTEMERLFGFPDHYTDVANLGRCGRQRLLGKAWSVPVLRHILSPLKDYFRSNTTRKYHST